MIVMKRDGREDHYSKTKIFNAINKAVKEVTRMSHSQQRLPQD